jgi:hypothetical protein
MNCNDFEDLLSEYLDAELSGASLQEFEQHRRECALCAMLLENVREASAALQDFPEFEPPAHLTERILDATSRAPKGFVGRLAGLLHVDRQFMPQLAAAAVVVLFVLSVAYNAYFRTGTPAHSRVTQESNLANLMDYTGNRLLMHTVRIYATVQETWDSVQATNDRVQNFFRSNWEQVKDVFRSNEKKKKVGEPERKNINQSLETHHSSINFA